MNDRASEVLISKHREVRIAGPEDAERIMKVTNSAFRPVEEFFIDGDRIDLQGVFSFFATGKFLLAEREDLLLGCVYVEPRETNNAHEQNRAYLGLLAVEPSHQHAGVGALLMEAAEDYCRGLGCRFMDMKVVHLREDLADYYRRRGYIDSGTSPFPGDLKTKLPCHFIDMSKRLADE